MIPVEILVKIMIYMNPKKLLKMYNEDPNLFNIPASQAYWRHYLTINTKFFSNTRVIRTFTNWGEIWVRYLNSYCLYCHSESARTDSWYEVPVCNDCKRQPNSIFECLTKTIAKKEYMLTDGDLDHLEYIETRNPYYRNASPMNLFLKSDVVAYANKKYDGKFQEVKDKKATKSKATKEKKATRREVRTAELKAALEMEGLELRSDSKLCQNYVDNKLHESWTIKAVVAMCAEMRWLHNHTNYPQLLKEAVHDMAEQIAEYEGWHGAHQKAYDEVEPDVRRQVLLKNPKPPIFPWQTPKTLPQAPPDPTKTLLSKEKRILQIRFKSNKE